MKRTTRPNWTKFVTGQGWILDADKARTAWNDATVTDGVPRWKSNGSVPPADCCEDWAEIGLPVDLAAAEAVRSAELDAFLIAYRANPPKPTAEALCEMAAEFGPGSVVVDIISGRKFKL